ncbi:uncharacterized protein PGTG_19977 [Puccinia graminis f. sp. tritici CRL 75-36-700-3]|uniref:Uncharacterized protein n=1 Tax=Puccinia graminis f. sp. tritici (strain CRL 75-36-700-3 / race SCCL) TaxID=418459 RepID=E3LBZ9_PUCGT|nr:uncharacterized protein PGTG_19977 [Puccinia graminis f. sp. tritici CRL 75-36-700-3]EFP94074.1 hypothetical protein PGTG_19977 [Puccinia graminis f. sp. tritici CRL 75-36-700-3]
MALSTPLTHLSERLKNSPPSPEDLLGLEISTMELEKTAKLIQYYLTLLASEKAQRAADYQPSDWELLTPEEQRARALRRVEISENERVANLLLWNSVKRDHKNKRRKLLAELRNKRLAKMSATSNSSAATTPAAGTTPIAETAANSPNTGRTIQTSTAPYPQPLDRGAANQLEERVNRLKLITIQKKMAPVTVERPTEATLAENGSTPAVETPATARATQVMASTAKKSAEKAADAMDIDPQASSFSADTQLRPKSPDVRVLSKEERIQLLVKEHVALWKRFLVDQPLGALEGNRALLTQAQDSQRALQKLIPRAEVEEYVKGWNPWTEKKNLFPVLQQERSGKNRSSSSRSNSYKAPKMNDPRRWKRLMKACHTLESGYMNMED